MNPELDAQQGWIYFIFWDVWSRMVARNENSNRLKEKVIQYSNYNIMNWVPSTFAWFFCEMQEMELNKRIEVRTTYSQKHLHQPSTD
jgi:hypothetical protein